MIEFEQIEMIKNHLKKYDIIYSENIDAFVHSDPMTSINGKPSQLRALGFITGAYQMYKLLSGK